MVNQEAILKVRNLVTRNSSNGDRYSVDRVETDLGRTEIGAEWIQDSTGRVTDQSQDTITTSNNGSSVLEDDELGAHTEQEAVSNNPHPVIEFSESEPHYPIVYSCAHSLLIPPQGQDEGGGEDTIPSLHDKRYDFFAPPSLEVEVEQPLLNVTSVPITLQLLLPGSTQGGGSLTSDVVVQNMDAMEWSLLNFVADTAGLRKNCNIDLQYNHRTLQRPPQQQQHQQSHSSLRRQRPVSEFGAAHGTFKVFHIPLAFLKLRRIEKTPSGKVR